MKSQRTAAAQDRTADEHARVSSPLVSVVIPTYDRARLLPDAIESVFAQGIEPLELIVVDDGSTDDTADVLARWNGSIRVHRQANSGIGAARNAGVELSRGRFLAFLDSDDYWLPGKLRRQLDELDRDPELEAVYGHVRQFYDPSVDEDFRRRHPIKTTVGPARLTGVMLVRREAFLRVGMFEARPGTHGGVDVDWGMRAQAAGLRSIMVPDVVMARRLHAEQISTEHGASANRERVLALKRNLDARRAAARQSDERTEQEQRQ